MVTSGVSAMESFRPGLQATAGDVELTLSIKRGDRRGRFNRDRSHKRGLSQSVNGKYYCGLCSFSRDRSEGIRFRESRGVGADTLILRGEVYRVKNASCKVAALSAVGIS